MKFRFVINLSENDYREYNEFCNFKAPFGKKHLLRLRLIIGGVILAFILLHLIRFSFSVASLVGCALLIIVGVLYELLLLPFMKLSIKNSIKIMKKNGKLPYPPCSVVEFYDDRLVEICPNNKSEINYSMIERISILGGKVIYIHINNASAYIIPFASFESDGQYGEFMEFIKTKNANITVY